MYFFVDNGMVFSCCEVIFNRIDSFVSESFILFSTVLTKADPISIKADVFSSLDAFLLATFGITKNEIINIIGIRKKVRSERS